MKQRLSLDIFFSGIKETKNESSIDKKVKQKTIYNIHTVHFIFPTAIIRLRGVLPWFRGLRVGVEPGGGGQVEPGGGHQVRVLQ